MAMYCSCAAQHKFKAGLLVGPEDDRLAVLLGLLGVLLNQVVGNDLLPSLCTAAQQSGAGVRYIQPI
jgi:hypothetical protein